ncbi:MAG: hypothetical protein HQL95_05755 [Magnetococcales bacterium]|nr:hypothetical protein [Magnetococcales bacterium]
MKDGILYPGVARHASIEQNLASPVQSPDDSLWLHAVDLTKPEYVKQIETTCPCDLHALFGNQGGPWLIQLRLDDRSLRAVVWAAQTLPRSTRDARIEAYAKEWQRLISVPDDPEWNRLLLLMTAVAQGGQVGVLDQVQALAKVPAAAVALALRVPHAMLPEVLAMDTATLLFWPVLSVTAFVEAVRVEYSRQIAKFSVIFKTMEAEIEAKAVLARRIGMILTLRPDRPSTFVCRLASYLFG